MNFRKQLDKLLNEVAFANKLDADQYSWQTAMDMTGGTGIRKISFYELPDHIQMQFLDRYDYDDIVRAISNGSMYRIYTKDGKHYDFKQDDVDAYEDDIA